MLGQLVTSSCGVAARRAKPQARRAKSEADADTQSTIFDSSASNKQLPIFYPDGCPNFLDGDAYEADITDYRWEEYNEHPKNETAQLTTLDFPL